jgi:hypothetical protein
VATPGVAQFYKKCGKNARHGDAGDESGIKNVSCRVVGQITRERHVIGMAFAYIIK